MTNANKHASWAVLAVVSAGPACVSPAAFAQTVVVAYDLDDVWLLPDINHPWESAQQMTGAFQWTYQEGDFENGAGQFTDLFIPWYGTDYQALNINIDVTSTEFTLPGNFHDLGLDLTLFLVEPLLPDQLAPLDTTRSMFDIQQGISHKGHVISGSIVPRLDSCLGDADGDRDVDLSDLALVLSQFGMFGTGLNGDVDNDGDVDVSDLAILLANFGVSCV